MSQIEKQARKIAEKFLRLLKKKNCYLEIYLVSNQKMKFLNKKFRHQNKTPSVLSFKEPKNFPHPESQLKFLGEIYLKSPIILRQAQDTSSKDTEQSRSANYKLLITLLAHGLLHLLGFQHQKRSDRIKMENKEKWLISSLV
jgi:probable rRNA maturation factor